MVWVKVCGLSRLAEVEAAVEAGADAIGLVVATSPRQITAEVAARLAASTSVLSVLVLVDAVPSQALDLARFAGVGGIQPHGLHAAGAAGAAVTAGLLVLRPWSPGSQGSPSDFPTDQIPLLDNAAGGLHGGTGQTFDHGLIPEMDRAWVLAGGLNPDNVAEAIRRTSPWGVDASSGLESSPGVKDINLIRTFVERAKGA